jgi:hypothetical protein
VLAATTSYSSAVAGLAAKRLELQQDYQEAHGRLARRVVLERARSELSRALVEDMFPPWFGTRWDFNGTSETPGEGFIACGYFVTTLLRDAGFRVQRIRLAQQASEQIVTSLAPPERTWRFRSRSIEEVLEGIRAQGEGLYVVGLDYHVGFLVHRGDAMDFCHSSFLDTAVVACEPAATSAGMASTYYVIGDVLTDSMLERWLQGRAIPTRRR